MVIISSSRYSPAAARGLRVVKPVVKGFGPTAGVKKACTPPRLLLPRWQASRAALARRERVVVACMTTTKLQHNTNALACRGRTSWGGGGPCGGMESGGKGEKDRRNECMALSITWMSIHSACHTYTDTLSSYLAQQRPGQQGSPARFFVAHGGARGFVAAHCDRAFLLSAFACLHCPYSQA